MCFLNKRLYLNVLTRHMRAPGLCLYNHMRILNHFETVHLYIYFCSFLGLVSVDLCICLGPKQLLPVDIGPVDI